MVVSAFAMSDKDSKKRFFKKKILLANVKSNIVFGILFLIMSNTDIYFQAQDLQ